MPSISDVFRRNETLSAPDLPPNVDVPVVITAVEPKVFDDGAKLQISFRNKQKCLLANMTNARAIALLWGDDYTQWVGKLIHLRRATTDFKGQLVECVRVSLTAPTQPASRLQPVERTPAPAMAPAAAPHDFGPDDEIPF